MYYEINVSLDGQHFFATAERSIQDEFKLKKVLKEIKEKFPRMMGYEVSVTYYEKRGTRLDIDTLLN